MKRYTAILLALILPAVILFGCGQSPQQEETNKLSIVCTIFPQYDWARQILGDQAGNVNLALLFNNRADLHNYQPSVPDIAMISTCDLFIYVGGESDGWVDDALAQASNPDMLAINLLEELGDAAKEEEFLEGMEENHDHDDDHDDEDKVDYDEHVWLSLKNAQVFCAAIADALAALDPVNAGVYQDNLAGYSAKLSALDAEYQAAMDAAQMKSLLFADRFPFRYLVDDYDLTYDAAFAGCSAETEASFDSIARLAKRVDEWGLHTVMVTESADQSIARTVIDSTAGKNQQILVLDAMQSVTMNDLQGGTTYLSIMKSNLAVLIEALK